MQAGSPHQANTLAMLTSATAQNGHTVFMLACMNLSLGLVLSSVNQRFLELERVVIKRIKRAPSA